MTLRQLINRLTKETTDEQKDADIMEIIVIAEGIDIELRPPVKKEVFLEAPEFGDEGYFF